MLTQDQIDQIYRMLEAGASARAISRTIGCHHDVIRRMQGKDMAPKSPRPRRVVSEKLDHMRELKQRAEFADVRRAAENAVREKLLQKRRRLAVGVND